MSESPQTTPIYLDHQATTPTDPRVVEAMLPFFNQQFANPASQNHEMGWLANDAVQKAREQVAQMLGARAKEIYFTSGATEANNLALQGLARSLKSPAHFITSMIEHPATLLTAQELEKQGHRLTYLEPDQNGRISAEQVDAAITDDTVLVSLMHVNNEIGTILNVREIGQACRAKQVLFHVDAAQSAGKLPLDVEADQIDLLSLSGHKMYGPKGVGALYVRSKNPRVRLKPLYFGGGQETGLRPGTLATPLLIGLGKACEINTLEQVAEAKHVGELRDKMRAELDAGIPGLKFNGDPDGRIYNNLNVLLPDLHRDVFYGNLRGLCYSTGSACATGSTEASHVLRGIGLSSDEARRSLRLGLGRFNTVKEILRASEIVVEAYKKARKG